MSKVSQDIFEHRGIFQEAVESLLLEAMSLDDIHAKYYSDIDKTVFDQIVSADPTTKDNKKGKYTEWLLKLYKAKRLKTDDLYKATEYLTVFNRFKNRINNVDLNRLKSLPELYDVVKPFMDNPDQSTSKSDEIRRIKEGAEKVYEDEKWLIIVPHTKEAAIYYGKHTQWCTAATKSHNYFNTYIEDYGDGCIYINIDKENNRKYQFCFDSDEFMDETDKPIDWPIAKEIGLTQGVVDFYNRVTGKEQLCFTQNVDPATITQIPNTEDYFYDSYISESIYWYNEVVDDYELVIRVEKGWFDVDKCLMGNFIPYLSETTGMATDLFDLKKRRWVFADIKRDDEKSIDYIKYYPNNDSEYVLCKISYWDNRRFSYEYNIFSLKEMEFVLDKDEFDRINNIRDICHDNSYSHHKQFYKDGLIIVEKAGGYTGRLLALLDTKQQKYLTHLIYDSLDSVYYEYNNLGDSLRFYVLYKGVEYMTDGDCRGDVILYDGTIIPKDEFDSRKKEICMPYIKQFAPYLMDIGTNEGLNDDMRKNVLQEALESLRPVYNLMDRLCETTLLTEDTLEQIYDKHYSEGKKKHIPQDVFYKIVAIDPNTNMERSHKGKFCSWLIDLYRAGGLNLDDRDELNNVRRYLEIAYKVNGFQINTLHSVDELHAAVEDYLNGKDTSGKAKERRIKKGAKLAYEDDMWLVIMPETEEASIYYGKGTKWCTAAIESTNLFDNYHNDGDLYVNINKQTKDKYQFFFRTNENSRRRNEFKNAPNHEVTNKDVGLSDNLIDFYITKYGIGFIDFMPDDAERIIDKLPDKEQIYTPEFLRKAFEKHWNAMLRVIVTGDFVIPEYVDLKGYIGLGGVFKGCTKMTSVTIPERFTEIPSNTFCGCTNLREVHLPNTLKKIDFMAFNGCTSLTSISIPNSVTEIGDWSFSECINLETMELPGSLKEIGRYCFSKCTNLSSITIPNSVVYIRDNAFCNCERLTSVNIPSSVKEIEESLFAYSGLTSIEIPNGVTTIGKNAFAFCENLETVIIPESVKNFGGYAFLGCHKLTFYVSNQEQYDAIHELTRGWGNIQMIQDRPVQTENVYHGIMMEALESLLLEAMDLDQIHHKYYSNMSEDNFWMIVQADPTYDSNNPDKKGKYTQWLLNLKKADKLDMNELSDAFEYLKTYDKFKNRIGGLTFDNTFTVSDLGEIVQSFIDDPDQPTSKTDEKRRIKEGAERVFEDKKWLVIVPHTKEAAIYYGKHTQWCTAATKSENYFNDYVKKYGDSCIYVNLDKVNKRKYQFCFKSGEYKDENNYSIPGPIADNIGLTDGLINFYRKKEESANVLLSKYNSDYLETIDGLPMYYVSCENDYRTLIKYNNKTLLYEDVLSLPEDTDYFFVLCCLKSQYMVVRNENGYHNLFDIKAEKFIINGNVRFTYYNDNSDYVVCDLYDNEEQLYGNSVFSMKEMRFILNFKRKRNSIKPLRNTYDRHYKPGLFINYSIFGTPIISIFDFDKRKIIADDRAYHVIERKYGRHYFYFIKLFKSKDERGDCDVLLFDGTLVPYVEFNKKVDEILEKYATWDDEED